MRSSAFGVSVGALSLLLCACTAPVTPAAKAAKVEKLDCGDANATASDLRARQATVLKIEPLYYWDLCFGIAKISGTKLVIQRPEGVSSAQMGRNLLCADARATLGHGEIGEPPSDPYGLPGAWVDIDVSPEGDNLAVTLRADTVPNNIRLLRRVRAFAAAQHSVAAQ
jgi:hypothetical protein